MTVSRALVTIGMPVYNGERWLAAAVESVLAQTLRDFVLVVSDNASNDGTQRICESYAAQDPRFQYSRNEKNIGLFKNYDRVFELSRTKYFKWASCHDICGARFLESCVSILESRADVVLAYPRTAVFDERVETATPYEDDLDLQQELASERLETLLARLKLNNLLNGVIRSDVLRKTALNKVYTGSDVNLVAELALHGKLVEVPEVLLYRRMNAAASSILVPENKRSEYFANENRDVLAMRVWKQELGYFSALWRAPLGLRERWRIGRYLAHRLASNRHKLRKELSAIMRSRFTSTPTNNRTH